MRLEDVDVEPTLPAIKTEPESDSDSPMLIPFPLQCQPYQCLYCLGKVDLPFEERLYNLGSKYSLQRHFDRQHLYSAGGRCPFPHPHCASVTIDSMMHFKNHVARVHGICMPDKV